MVTKLHVSTSNVNCNLTKYFAYVHNANSADLKHFIDMLIEI